MRDPRIQEPLFREFVHWVVANIPSAAASASSPSAVQGHVIAPYVGAGPPHASGLHRYGCDVLSIIALFLCLLHTRVKASENLRLQIPFPAVPTAQADVARSTCICSRLLQPKANFRLALPHSLTSLHHALTSPPFAQGWTEICGLGAQRGPGPARCGCVLSSASECYGLWSEQLLTRGRLNGIPL